MPRRSGTGPAGGGRRMGGSGMGRGRMGGSRPGSGPEGNCLCPKCGARVPHRRGAPCYATTCPKCGSLMTRE